MTKKTNMENEEIIDIKRNTALLTIKVNITDVWSSLTSLRVPTHCSRGGVENYYHNLYECGIILFFAQSINQFKVLCQVRFYGQEKNRGEKMYKKQILTHFW